MSVSEKGSVGNCTDSLTTVFELSCNSRLARILANDNAETLGSLCTGMVVFSVTVSVVVVVISTDSSLTSIVVTVAVSTVTDSFFSGIALCGVAGTSRISGASTESSKTRP